MTKKNETTATETAAPTGKLKVYNVTLHDLLQAGNLKAGTILTAVYKGNRYQARVQKDGTIKYEGEVYNSLSTLGRIILANQGVAKPAVNGWMFFTVKVSGETITLKALRDLYLGR